MHLGDEYSDEECNGGTPPPEDNDPLDDVVAVPHSTGPFSLSSLFLLAFFSISPLFLFFDKLKGRNLGNFWYAPRVLCAIGCPPFVVRC